MVIAVDPAELSPMLQLPNVHHIQRKSELAGKFCDGSHLEGKFGTYCRPGWSLHVYIKVQCLRDVRKPVNSLSH